MALIKVKCTLESRRIEPEETTILINDEIIFAVINNEVIIKEKHLNAYGGITVKDYILSNIRIVNE